MFSPFCWCFCRVSSKELACSDSELRHGCLPKTETPRSLVVWGDFPLKEPGESSEVPAAVYTCQQPRVWTRNSRAFKPQSEGNQQKLTDHGTKIYLK